MKYDKDQRFIQDGNRTIPCDPANSEYQDILRRIRDEGLVIEPYIPPPEPTPEEALKRFAHSQLGEITVTWAALQAAYSELTPEEQAKAGPLRTKLRDLIVTGVKSKIGNLP